ncbi:hypothetical protein ml_20 [Mollivirus sibericum]|uniref:hypothetical protein n=1 Tax=Mollivirus sibericum TaxID=1678078 RepID=UPI0006B2E8BB|nr:hypothetical protein ml_20 [Mollivirus sibericum]ALD61822.1 hypothetical protein ml_20 [Mollivirus sibericum]
MDSPQSPPPVIVRTVPWSLEASCHDLRPRPRALEPSRRTPLHDTDGRTKRLFPKPPPIVPRSKHPPPRNTHKLNTTTPRTSRRHVTRH